MKASDFPRVIKRGPLRGRKFNSNAEYMAALRKFQQTNGVVPKRRTRSKDMPAKFELFIHIGTMTITVKGDPRSSKDIDTLVDALASVGKEA
jgi:hypothetical protein